MFKKTNNKKTQNLQLSIFDKCPGDKIFPRISESGQIAAMPSE